MTLLSTSTPRVRSLACGFTLCLALVHCANSEAQTSAPERLHLNGKTFEVSGRPAFVLEPTAAPSDGPLPWILYAPTLPSYPDENEKWMLERFSAAGVAVAGIDIGEAYGSPSGRKIFDALYDELTSRGYSKRPCLFARSRGGLWLCSWAADHPERVAGIIGIYPAFDLQSYPGIEKAAPAYGLSPAELQARIKDFNPVDRIEILAKAKIPVAFIHGDQDSKVPLASNSQRFIDVYEACQEKQLTTLIICKGQEHSLWAGYFQSDVLVGKALAWAKGLPDPK